MEGWVDNTHEDAFTHTVRLARRRPDAGGRAWWRCRRRPTRSGRRAARRWPARSAPSLAEAFARLAGAAMVGGLTPARRRADRRRPTAPRWSSTPAIEVARLARQVARLPREPGRAGDGGRRARVLELDTTGWVDLPNSCFTYSAAGRALFGTPHGGDADGARSLQPAARARRGSSSAARWRAWSARTGGCASSTRCTTTSTASRSPTRSTWPRGRDRARRARDAAAALRRHLLGAAAARSPRCSARRADAGLRKRIQSHLGGEAGCAQLYDLTADLLKLLACRTGSTAGVSVGRRPGGAWTRRYTTARCRSCPSASSPPTRCRPSSTSTRPSDPRVVVGPRVGEDAAVIDIGDRYLVATSRSRSRSPPTSSAGTRCTSTPTTSPCAAPRPRWFLATLLLPEGAHRRGHRVERCSPSSARRARSWRWRWSAATPRSRTGSIGRSWPARCWARSPRTGSSRPRGAQVGDADRAHQGRAARGRGHHRAREGRRAARARRAGRDDPRGPGASCARPGISVLPEAEIACELATVHAMHDPTEGGIATALHELADAGRRGAADRPRPDHGAARGPGAVRGVRPRPARHHRLRRAAHDAGAGRGRRRHPRARPRGASTATSSARSCRAEQGVTLVDGARQGRCPSSRRTRSPSCSRAA